MTSSRRPVLLRSSTACLALGGLLLAAPAVSQPSSAPTTAAIDAFVAKTMAEEHMAAASIAIVKDGKVVLAKGYGLADREKGIQATAQTVYQIGSLTKSFTAAAVLMLVEEGRLSLEAKVTDLVAGLPAAWSGITVRHLLNQTSGIADYPDLIYERKIPWATPFTRDALIALFRDIPLRFEPGTQHAYSNGGYYLLGVIIEKASGRPYGDFLTRRIFVPLGMTSTGVDDFADARPIRARPYRVVDKKIAPADHSHPSQPFAAGVLVSTVLDLVEWELEARKLLKPASYDAMWTPPTLPGRSLSEYAFGWYVDPLRGHRRHQHSGGITGYSAYLHRFPDDRLTVVVLSNHEDGGSTPLARGIAELYVPALKAP